MIAQPADQTNKYRVQMAAGGWRVESAEACLGVFDSAASAIDQACRSARADADLGRVAIVTTETVPQELHCYLPAPGQQSAVPAGVPPYLRLLVSN
jgi:hypothetical protein